jgi:hypothetical protein
MRIIVLALSLIASSAYSQELTYPELNVVPRASERVKLEIREEAGNAWSSNLAVQLSSLSTLAAGAMAGSSVDTEKDEDEVSPKVAMAVGAAWLGATAWAAMSYRPYRAAFRKLKKMPYKTKRQKLIVERLAEEEINSLRSLGKRIRWYSAVSNLAASAFLLDSVKGESDAKMAASVSALLSLGPIFFKYNWENIADEQEKYKKKIYTPVAVMPIFNSPFNISKRAAGLNLLYTF